MAETSDLSLPLLRYLVTFESNLAGDQLHTEKVYARDQLTAVARAAWTSALKGYEVIAVHSVEWTSA